MPLHHALDPMIRRLSSREEAETEAAQGQGRHVVALDDKGIPVPHERWGWSFLGPRLHWFVVRDATADDALVRNGAGVFTVTDPSGEHTAPLNLSYALTCRPDRVARAAQQLFGTNPANVLHEQLRSWTRAYVKDRGAAFFGSFPGEVERLARHLEARLAEEIGLEGRVTVTAQRKAPAEPELDRRVRAYLKDTNIALSVRYWLRLQPRSGVLPEDSAGEKEIGALLDEVVTVHLLTEVRAHEVRKRPQSAEASARAAVDRALLPRALATSHFQLAIDLVPLHLPPDSLLLDVTATVTTSHGDLPCRFRGRLTLSDASRYPKVVGASPVQDWLKQACAEAAQVELYGQPPSALRLGFSGIALRIKQRTEARFDEAGLAVADLEVETTARHDAPREVRSQFRIEVPTATFAVVMEVRAISTLADEARYLDAGRPDVEGELKARFAERAGQMFHQMDAAAVRRGRDAWRPPLEQEVASAFSGVGYRLTSVRLDLQEPDAGSPKDIELDVTEQTTVGARRARVRARGRAGIELVDALRHRESAVTDLAAWAERALRRALVETLAAQPLADVVLRPERVRIAVYQRLHPEIERTGYKITTLGLEIEHDGDLGPREEDRVLTVEHRFKTRIGQRDVWIDSTVKLERHDDGQFVESGTSDLRGWICRELEHATIELLFHRSFTDVSRDREGIEGEVRQRLNDRAATIGYRVDQVLTLPDGEIELGVPFLMEAKPRGLETAIQGVTVGLDAAVTLRIDDLEAVRPLLDRGASVKDVLASEIEHAVREALHGIEPSDFCWRFQGSPQAPAPSPRETLDTAIRARLGAYRVGVVAINLKPVKPEVFTRLEPLHGRRLAFTVVLEATAERAAVTYQGTLRIVGVDLAGINAVQTWNPDAEQLVAQIKEHLQSQLRRESADLLLVDAHAEDLERSVRRLISEFVPRSFGLGIVLETWDRQRTGIEVHQGRRWEMEVDLAGNERARTQRAFEALSERLEKAWVEGTPEEIEQLEARRRTLLAKLAPLVPQIGSGTAEHAWPAVLAPRVAPKALRAPDGAAQPLGEPSQIISLTIQAPPQGYPTSDADCRVDLEARISLLAPGGKLDGLTKQRLRRDVQSAISAVVRVTDPADLYLRFDHRTGDTEAPDERIRNAITGVVPEQRALIVEAVELSAPTNAHQERFRRLKGRILVLDERDVRIAGRGKPVKLSASIEVEDVMVPGGWAQFERRPVETTDILHRAGHWLEEQLREHVERRKGDLEDIDLGALQELARAELGRPLGLRLRVSIHVAEERGREVGELDQTLKELDRIQNLLAGVLKEYERDALLVEQRAIAEKLRNSDRNSSLPLLPGARSTAPSFDVVLCEAVLEPDLLHPRAPATLRVGVDTRNIDVLRLATRHIDVLVIASGADVVPLGSRLHFTGNRVGPEWVTFEIVPTSAGRMHVEIVLLVRNEPVHRMHFDVVVQDPADLPGSEVAS